MDRATRLRKIFEGIIKGSILISPQRSGDFLDSITSQDDIATCVSKLIGSKAGLSALQDCMRYDLSSNFFNRRGADILVYLQDPGLNEIAGGTFLQPVLTKIVDPPIFWYAFVAAFRGGKLEEKAQIAFTGLFLQLLSLSEVDEAHRELAEDSQLMDLIIDSPNASVRALGAKIKSIISVSMAKGVVVTGAFKPGGRHDNDFANIADIAILPTAAEISSTEAPFIRPSDFLEDPDTLDQRVEIYLDNQFRLLREDMLHEMREEVLIASKQKKGFHRGLILNGLQIVDMFTGPDDRKCKWGITLQCESDPWIFKKVKAKDRKAFLDDNRNRYFRHQSLVCLMVKGEIVAFPTLYRDETLLAKKPSVLVLQLEGTPTVQALIKLKSAQSSELCVILIDTAVFSFEPILQTLKEMTTLPLSSELLFWDKESVLIGPSNVNSRLKKLISVLKAHPHDDLQNHLSTSKSVVLDQSQHVSLISALTQNLSLIQGPPGKQTS